MNLARGIFSRTDNIHQSFFAAFFSKKEVLPAWDGRPDAPGLEPWP
jgi:hypothetical protein